MISEVSNFFRKLGRLRTIPLGFGIMDRTSSIQHPNATVSRIVDAVSGLQAGRTM